MSLCLQKGCPHLSTCRPFLLQDLDITRLFTFLLAFKFFIVYEVVTVNGSQNYSVWMGHKLWVVLARIVMVSPTTITQNPSLVEA